MKRIVFGLMVSAAAAFCLAQAEVDEATAKRRAEALMRNLGGFVMKPGTGLGRFLVVNAQKRVDKSVIDEQLPFMSKFIGVRIESAPAKGTPTVETAAKHFAETGGQMALFVVDAPSLPSLLIAPESKWGFLNVAALAADGATGKDLDRRVQREIWRGVSMVGGSGNTEMPHCLLNTVLTPLDLDNIDGNTISYEPLGRMAKHMRKAGITQVVMRPYIVACREGWAATPTNEYQKAIWDKVHALPTEPIKIKPETKKVTE